MKTDKELKKDFKVQAAAEPEKYYATTVLIEEGFHRGACSKCGLTFWSTDKERKVCGDPSCTGGFDLSKGTPAKNKFTFTEVWTSFKEFFAKRDYTPIDRYPVIARWNPTADFVMASIAAFQPYVISGEIDPPAKRLVIPQFSLRFGDVDNVGITGSHCTGFVMIGQHMFVPPEEWSQEKAFRDIYEYLIDCVGLDKNELTLHEDAWAGGGNFGPCMEFFSRGVELFNQVYMMFEQLPNGDIKGLDLKVLDMGLGQERIAWFSQGTSNMYEATFPKVLSYLLNKTGAQRDEALYKKFSQYSAYLNADEVDDMDEAWSEVAKKMDISVDDLKEKIEPMAAIYSIAEHARALLLAISDGGLPSNVGGGYNLRVIFRRAASFIDKFGWQIDLGNVAEQHALELEPQYPELIKSIDQVRLILSIELKKYKATKEKAAQLIKKMLEKDEQFDEKTFLELYDSQGISPETIVGEAKKLGKKIKVPDNFYAKVAELHEKQVQKYATGAVDEMDLEGIPPTVAKYFDNYKITNFKAKVLKVDGNKVVLDHTYFYPTSGGQDHDIGTLNGHNVVDVKKQGHHIIHIMENEAFQEGDDVEGQVDEARRKQLSQHHTAAHVLNGVCKAVLGPHIWQAGAAKSTEKARLDITHFEILTKEQMETIEKECNEVIRRNLPVYKKFMPRKLAEDEYGFSLYQGGVAPGKELRIVEMPNFDVEACGGTHLDMTGELDHIVLIKSTKVQDGIVRIEFAAGKAAEKFGDQQEGILDDLAEVLKCTPEQTPGRAEELFGLWKKVVKKKKDVDSKELKSTAAFEGDALEKVCEVFKTQPEHVVNTARRFLKELGV